MKALAQTVCASTYFSGNYRDSLHETDDPIDDPIAAD